MIPSEKAKELVDKFMYGITFENESFLLHHEAKQCALICCDEVLSDMGADRGYQFWVKVKQEIIKL